MHVHFNSKECIIERMRELINFNKISPNFIILDFVEVGDGMEIVQYLNETKLQEYTKKMLEDEY